MICPQCGTKNEIGTEYCRRCGTSLQQPVYREYAGFWRRFCAALIDDCPFSLTVVISIWYGSRNIYSGIFAVGILAAVIVVRWIYFAGLESSSKQATVGKIILSIIVTDMEGNRISFGKATIRHFAKILSGLLFYAGFVMIAFTEKRQGLHDMIAGCLVVKKEHHPGESSDYYTRTWQKA